MGRGPAASFDLGQRRSALDAARGAAGKQGGLKRVGSGKNLIDVVHVEHAAMAHLQALEKLLQRDTAVNGQAFFITDGQPVQCWEWIGQILDCAQVPVPQGP